MVGSAIVGGDDPQLAGAGPHAQIGFVVLKADLRPLVATATAIDGVEYDASAQAGELLREVGVGLWGTAGVGPEVVADQAAQADAGPVVGAQGGDRVALDLAARWVGEAASGQGLGVEPQIGTVTGVETDLVVTAPIAFEIASAQR